MRRRIQTGHWIQHQVESHLGQLRVRQHRRPAMLHHIGDGRFWRPAPHLGQFLQRPRRLYERRVSPGRSGGLHPVQGLVQADRRQGVGPRNNEEVVVRSRFHRGANFLEILVPVDHPLALHVSAALGPLLVFQKTACRPGVDQFGDGAHDVQRVPISSIGVHQDRYVDGAADVPCPLDNLGLGQQAQVRLAKQRGRDRVAGDERERESGLLGNLGGHGVVDAGEHQRSVNVENA